jgi:hypothetical protein
MKYFLKPKILVIIAIITALLDFLSTKYFIDKLGWVSEGNPIAEWIFMTYGTDLISFIMIIPLKIPYFVIIGIIIIKTRSKQYARSTPFMLIYIWILLNGAITIGSNFNAGINYQSKLSVDYPVNSTIFTSVIQTSMYFAVAIGGYIAFTIIMLSLIEKTDKNGIMHLEVTHVLMIMALGILMFII